MNKRIRLNTKTSQKKEKIKIALVIDSEVVYDKFGNIIYKTLNNQILKNNNQR